MDSADVTGWCQQGRHDACHGKLLSGTGYHWFCVCKCHPDPTVTVNSGDLQKALRVFREARALIEVWPFAVNHRGIMVPVSQIDERQMNWPTA